MARNKIDRSNLGEKPFKIFNAIEIENDNAKPAYFYYPLINLSSVPVYRNGIEKMNIFWPKHWWQKTLVVEVYNSKENIGRPKFLYFWEVVSLRSKFYPRDWDILQSVMRAFTDYLKKENVEKNSLEEPDAFIKFKQRIADPYLKFQLEFRLGYLEWPNHSSDPSVLASPYTKHMGPG